MPTINFNGTSISFNRLVCYGCSFTAGGELGDIYLLAKKTEDQISEIKKNLGIEKFNQLSEVRANKSGYYSDKKGRELAWPAALAKKFNVPYKNRAHGGSSLGHAIFHLETDLHRPDVEFGIDIDNDLIIVGITSESRWFYIDKDGNPMKPIVNNANQWPGAKFYKEFILHCSNDNNMMYSYIVNLKYLDMLSKSLGGRILVQPCLQPFNDFHIKDSITEEYLRRFLKKTVDSLTNVIDPTISMYDFFDRADELPWGHPPKYAHDSFAEELYNKLTRERNE